MDPGGALNWAHKVIIKHPYGWLSAVIGLLAHQRALLLLAQCVDNSLGCYSTCCTRAMFVGSPTVLTIN